MLTASVVMVITEDTQREHLWEQLDSIREQTRPADEVLLFDNTHQQFALDYLKEHPSWDNKWFVLHYQAGDQSYNNIYTHAMQRAKMDVVFPADQDDVWRADKIEMTMKIMFRHPNINVLCSNFTTFDDTQHNVPEVFPQSSKEELALLSDGATLLSTYHTPLCTMAVRRSFITHLVTWLHQKTPLEILLSAAARLSQSGYIYTDSFVKLRLTDNSWSNHYNQSLATYKGRRNDCLRQIETIDELLHYNQVELIQSPQYQDNLRLLKHQRKFLERRKNYIDHGNYFTGLLLLKDKQWFDNIITFIDDYRVGNADRAKQTID